MLTSKVSRRAILAGAAAVGLGRGARAQTLPSIRLCGAPDDGMTPIFYALKNDLYQKAGLDLTFVPISSGTAATVAVLANTYELAKASPMAPILAHIKGLPMTIVANGDLSYSRLPFSAVVVAADAGIATAADCNGKTGASPGLTDINSLAMMRWIDLKGGNSATIKWVEVPGSAVAAALVEHRVDLALLVEPQLSAALQTGKVRVLADAYAAIANGWLTSAFVGTRGYADAHPDAMRTFARVTYQAAAYTNAHKAETVALMAEVTKIPSAVYARMSRSDDATTASPALLQPVIDLAAHYKAIPQSFPAREMYWAG